MDLRGNLDLLLLNGLARTGPVHGYALIAAVFENSDGALKLPEGTVYPALHRLERDGLIESHWDTVAPRRRRVYAITTEGQAARVSRNTEWVRFSGGVEKLLASVNASPQGGPA